MSANTELIRWVLPLPLARPNVDVADALQQEKPEGGFAPGPLPSATAGAQLLVCPHHACTPVSRGAILPLREPRAPRVYKRDKTPTMLV